MHRFRIDVIRGPDRGKSVLSDGDEFSVGTAEGNQLVLRDGSVSRSHLLITSGTRSFHIRDLGSTNGTYINDLRIESAYVHASARIRVGVTTLAFEALDETVTQALSTEQEFDGIVGQSVTMRRLFALIPSVASADVAVLLLGETGTGKTAFAETLHDAGPRADEPFVVIDCGSMPPTLIESELFGHEKGAFTGAIDRKVGAFEHAGKGTVLLDEIGELPLSLQPKLLRVLESKRIRRVGGVEPIEIGCRILAATNRDLRYEVNTSAFRSDLFYRLNTVTLVLPPLRDRREDIPLLAAALARRIAGPEYRLDPEWLDEWSKRDWPGNVRELRNAVERHVLLGNEHTGDPYLEISPDGRTMSGARRKDSIAPVDVSAAPFREAKEQAILNWERNYLRALMRATDDNLSEAARRARTDRGYLRGLLKKHGIR